LDSVIPIFGAGLFAAAAVGDARRRRIPNALAAAVAALGLVRLILAGDSGAALDSIAVAAAVFAVGFLLFWGGLIGGGDVKLITAAVLLVGYHALFEFLAAMSLFGLVVTLVVLAADRLAARPSAESLGATYDPPPAPPTVPYGVAIAAAGVVTLVLQSVVTG
jgi:prepilin peptidase CpaA